MNEETNVLLRQILDQLVELNKNFSGTNTPHKKVVAPVEKPGPMSDIAKDIEKMRKELMSQAFSGAGVGAAGGGMAGMGAAGGGMPGFGMAGMGAGIGPGKSGMPDIKKMIEEKRKEAQEMATKKMKEGMIDAEVIKDTE